MISKVEAGEIRQRLMEAQLRTSPYGLQTETAEKEAAVLVPLCKVDGEWALLFIHRAENERDRHSGQVAFPGGRVEADDVDYCAAALRETEEEVGISRGHIEVLGEMTPFNTLSGYKVKPIVGCIPWPYELNLGIEEVSHCFTWPLRWLADPENFEVTQRQLQDKEISVVQFLPRDGELLWGLTAAIVRHFLDILFVPYEVELEQRRKA